MSTPSRPPIIGLAGGIGSGKSAVAHALAALGCAVVDSDAQAKRALERDDVRKSIVSWWGPSVLKPDGSIDRSKIAAIVFADPAQRTRLESLIHPLIKVSREQAFAKAISAGAKACVIDAPLLFEAGLDQGCDAVIFVDAPLELRQARVRSSRGWDAAELTRREAAQMPIEEKRRRSTHTLMNSGSEADLERKVRQTLSDILAGRRG